HVALAHNHACVERGASEHRAADGRAGQPATRRDTSRELPGAAFHVPADRHQPHIVLAHHLPEENRPRVAVVGSGPAAEAPADGETGKPALRKDLARLIPRATSKIATDSDRTHVAAGLNAGRGCAGAALHVSTNLHRPHVTKADYLADAKQLVVS